MRSSNSNICHLVFLDGWVWCLPSIWVHSVIFRHLQNLSTVLGTEETKMKNSILCSQTGSYRLIIVMMIVITAVIIIVAQ